MACSRFSFGRWGSDMEIFIGLPEMISFDTERDRRFRETETALFNAIEKCADSRVQDRLDADFERYFPREDVQPPAVTFKNATRLRELHQQQRALFRPRMFKLAASARFAAIKYDADVQTRARLDADFERYFPNESDSLYADAVRLREIHNKMDEILNRYRR
jgi:hypothetical protein